MTESVDHRRLDEVPVFTLAVGQTPASEDDLATLGLRLPHGAFEALHGRLVDDGTHGHATIQRVADCDRAQLFDEPVEKLVLDVAVRVHTRARGALLPLRAERRTSHALRGLLDVGAPHHNRRVLAAHFRDERPRDGPFGVVADHLHPDGRRAREHHAVDVGVVDERLTRPLRRVDTASRRRATSRRRA